MYPVTIGYIDYLVRDTHLATGSNVVLMAMSKFLYDTKLKRARLKRRCLLQLIIGVRLSPHYLVVIKDVKMPSNEKFNPFRRQPSYCDGSSQELPETHDIRYAIALSVDYIVENILPEKLLRK